MHQPVLLHEVMEVLQPRQGMFYIDGTIGSGGHASSIIERIAPKGTLLGIDRDPSSVSRAKEYISHVVAEQELDVAVTIREGNFGGLAQIISEYGERRADVLLIDLGFSSDQLISGKGFSFRKDEPLIMRYDGDAGKETAAQVVNGYPEAKLAEVLKEYGGERSARRIARSIVRTRRKNRIRTTGELVEVINEALSGMYRPKLHPATRTFQALRILVNRELENLEQLLSDIPNIVAPGGRVAIISFHSLEDRLVKQRFKALASTAGAVLLTKKPITPSEGEVKRNPRSRSAKLRAITLKPKT